MLKKSIFLLLISVSVFYSCSTDSREIDVVQYFDVPNFFQKEIELLESRKARVIKVLSTGGESSTITSSPNWKKELDIFHSINLNKSAYIGKYLIDTSLMNEGFLVSYNAIEEGLPIRKLSYYTSNEQVKEIEVNKVDKSLVLSSELNLRYVPDSGYSVSGVQQIGNLQKSEYKVSAIFVNNQIN